MALDTTRTRLHPPILWRWMLSVLLAALVMVGLLGMHTLMTGHSDAPMAAMASIDAEHGHGSSGDTDSVAETTCADCVPGGAHDALMAACVLGLLAVVLWAARSGPGVIRGRSRGPGPLARVVGVLLWVLPRPPSLLDLSISRT